MTPGDEPTSPGPDDAEETEAVSRPPAAEPVALLADENVEPEAAVVVDGEAGQAQPRHPRAARRRAARKARRAARSRRRKWAVRSGIGFVALIAVIVAATAGYSIYRLNEINRINSTSTVAQHGTTENILLIGSTDRCSAQNIKQFKLQCDTGTTGINSDVVLIMHLDTGTGKASLLSIPRDTFVPDARSGGLYNKIDAALANGPNQLIDAIEQDFGIPINHFVELNFESFEGVVDALGGLHMFFPRRLVDASSGLNVHHVGCLPFNGQESLELVRSRHLYWFTKDQTPNLAAIQAATVKGTYYTSESGGQYDGTGDLGRITRVHLFLKALGDAVKQRGLGNLVTDNALIGALAPNLTVDSTLSDSQLVHLISTFRNINIGATPEYTAPIINNAVTYSYKGYPYGLVVFPTEPQDQATINAFLGTTPAGWKLAPSSISVSVVDGTASPTGTASVAHSLGALGYKIVPTTATDYVGPVSETSVIYAKGHIDQAQRVKHSLAGTVVLAQGKPADGADVSVVTGSYLAVAKPAVATAAAVTPSANDAILTAAVNPAATLPTPTSTDPNFGPPTSSNAKVTQFDPRSCKPTK